MVKALHINTRQTEKNWQNADMFLTSRVTRSGHIQRLSVQFYLNGQKIKQPSALCCTRAQIQYRGKWGWNWFTILSLSHSILRRAHLVFVVWLSQSAADANRRWQQQTPTASLSECKVNTERPGVDFCAPIMLEYSRYRAVCLLYVRTRPLPAACHRNWVCLFVLIPPSRPPWQKRALVNNWANTAHRTRNFVWNFFV
jgi:hypothetical protein